MVLKCQFFAAPFVVKQLKQQQQLKKSDRKSMSAQSFNFAHKFSQEKNF